MGPSWLQILIVVILALVLFGGRGKISELMGDFAKGIKSFKSGMKEDVAEAGAERDIKTIDHKKEEPVASVAAKERKAG
jgi:sec-independent protein translocase protein TatA